MSIFKSTASFRDFQRPEYALRHFIRFVAAKLAITYAMDLMVTMYTICGGVVEQKACSLVGKVTYFWVGKSSAIGWNSEWGKMKTVTAAGSVTTGKTRPFGLDCSGFVTWIFINAGFSESYIGHGVGNQAAKGVRITWDEAEPGDLAVYSDNSHIGIVAGRKDNGSILVIHCNAGANNVVITDEEGFGYCVRVVG